MTLEVVADKTYLTLRQRGCYFLRHPLTCFRISIGERCLLGANSGLGISLGDDCVVEAGLYITAGTKVVGPDGSVVKARDLAGQSNLLFRRNSTTGAVEVSAKEGDGIALNEALHANN